MPRVILSMEASHDNRLQGFERRCGYVLTATCIVIAPVGRPTEQRQSPSLVDRDSRMRTVGQIQRAPWRSARHGWIQLINHQTLLTSPV